MGAHLSHPPRLAEQSISSNLGTSVCDIRSSTLFQCKNPYALNMQNTETRIAIFDHRWEQEKMLVQPKELADAGFYFLGSRDHTKCFIVVVVCTVGNQQTIPGMSMPNGILPVNIFSEKKVWNL